MSTRKGQLPRGKIKAQRYLNGELHFRYGQDELAYTLLVERPQSVSKAKRKKRAQSDRIMDKYVPPPTHAWRKFQFGKGVVWPRS